MRTAYLDFRSLSFWARLRLAFAIIFKTNYRFYGTSDMVQVVEE